jgi:hypothetical protein
VISLVSGLLTPILSGALFSPPVTCSLFICPLAEEGRERTRNRLIECVRNHFAVFVHTQETER